MTLFERVQQLCAQRNIAFFALEKACGLSNGSLNKWKTTNPSIDKVSKLADFLGVSIDYLFNGTEHTDSNVPITPAPLRTDGIELSPDEEDFLSRYRRLNPRDKLDVSDSVDTKLAKTYSKAHYSKSSTSNSGPDSSDDDDNGGCATA